MRGIISVITGLINVIFVMVIEALLLALPFWFFYSMVAPKFGLPIIGYIDCFSILMAIKVAGFTTLKSIFGGVPSQGNVVVLPKPSDEKED